MSAPNPVPYFPEMIKYVRDSFSCTAFVFESHFGLFFLKVKFALQKKDGGKAADQQATTSSTIVERDPELESIENSCYAELLECCKKLALDAGVNYTTIMNLQVCLSLI